MNKIILTTELINGILQYLGNRPYVEVAGFINGIQQQVNEQNGAPVQEPVQTPTE
jgi:hypothetical protein